MVEKLKYFLINLGDLGWEKRQWWERRKDCKFLLLASSWLRKLQVRKSCTHGGRLASLAPGTLFLAKEDMWMCQSFLTFLGPNSDCQGYSGHFLGLFWGGARAAKVNLLTFFWGFASSISSKLIQKISRRIEEGEEICSNYLDDPETTYCSRSSRQVK